ncbi:MAG TPA: PGPGW domain-containing protein [Acidimicrobiales bacterium]|nr:PGPGW domain-containing protein [Acidimicrobiales bacterium]
MAPRPAEVIRFIGRSAKRVAVTVVGAALVLGGVVMLPLPGPGWLVIFLGLAVLATEYVWAATALERAKGLAARGGSIAKDAARKVIRRG